MVVRSLSPITSLLCGTLQKKLNSVRGSRQVTNRRQVAIPSPIPSLFPNNFSPAASDAQSHLLLLTSPVSYLLQSGSNFKWRAYGQAKSCGAIDISSLYYYPRAHPVPVATRYSLRLLKPSSDSRTGRTPAVVLAVARTALRSQHLLACST
jgi:hypothetical protein